MEFFVVVLCGGCGGGIFLAPCGGGAINMIYQQHVCKVLCGSYVHESVSANDMVAVKLCRNYACCTNK